MSVTEFVKILAQYVLDRQLRADTHDKDTGTGSFSATVWSDIERIFQELGTNLMQPDAFNKGICDSIYSAQGGKLTPQKMICRQIVNIFLFMDGIHRNGDEWSRAKDNEQKWKFQKYIRCIMGNVALVELFWTNCQHREIVEAVSTHMNTWREGTKYTDNSAWCKNLDYGTLKLGTKFVAATMAGWIRNWARKRPQGKIVGTGAKTECNTGSETDLGAGAKGQWEPIGRMFAEGDAKVVHKLIETGKSMTEQQRKKIIEIIKHSKDPKNIMEDILDTVSKCTAPGNACVQSALESVHTSVTPVPPNPADHDPSAISASAAEDSVGTPPGSTTSARGSGPQAPASPVLPARPPPPPPPPGGAASGSKGEKGATGKSTDTKCNSKVHTQEDKGSVDGSSITITFSTPDTSPGCTGTQAVDNNETTDQNQTAAQVPATTTPASSGSGGKDGEAGTSPAPGESDDKVADGANDDPPPLNPPKPKPTTPSQHPNQAGATSSGAAGSPTAAGTSPDGGSGGAVGGGTGGSSDGGGRGGAGGSGTALTPATPSVPPGLTWADIKPYTPAIIPAVVGIGIIAFFLWKDELWDSHEGKNFISKLRVKWAMKHGLAQDRNTTQLDVSVDIGGGI
ncbi:hypothetical protein AK88_01259 [Plasmodium fragile]|uniref:Schizont-infected cell agglutination extracellular alpha domain-containing protein n=1 Tax=Plasmodium fragile TaxID=5857 RepID=A0A0D9QQI7_PLAFR|nr:uncharacterized protein AK88_01259 [Plasmodium fragile]KJP89173.1 hypothetical protein AK88_01259 [Plasmodium fragile]